MKYLLIFILMPVFFLSSCKTLKKNPVESTHEETIEVDDGEIAYEMEDIDRIENNFLVNFLSRGEGINHEMKAEFDEFLKNFEKEHNDFLRVSVLHWGREGETEYCIYFMIDDQSLRETFIEEVENMMSEANLVIVSKNRKCRK
jgi:hypothetical protein